MAPDRGVDDPSQIHDAVQDAFNRGDLDALVSLYEADATMVTPVGEAVGVDAIRANWADLLALGTRMELTSRYVLRNGDLALLRNDYVVIGDAIELSGATTEVVRRQADGTWRYVIDHPFGAAP